MDNYQIALIVVGILSVVLGGFLKHFVNLVRQSGELLTYIANAFEDGALTKKEFLGILKEAKDVAEAWALIMNAIMKKK